jgi:hypothetical protein
VGCFEHLLPILMMCNAVFQHPGTKSLFVLSPYLPSSCDRLYDDIFNKSVCSLRCLSLLIDFMTSSTSLTNTRLEVQSLFSWQTFNYNIYLKECDRECDNPIQTTEPFFFPLLMSILSNNLVMCKVLKSISRMLIKGFGQATPLYLIISRMTEACNMKS